jgi:hypothetical protein
MAINRTILPAIIIFASVVSAFGQETMQINRLNGNIDFDGIPDETIITYGNKIELTMHAPDFGEAPKEKSDVYIGYNNDYLWVSANLYYSDPSLIVSTSRKRDETSENTDLFGIVLDTYNDNENALAFFTTPAGQRIDYTVSNDAQSVAGSGSVMNYSWNTFWDVKTVKHEKGWSVEIRIPFSSLRFQTVNNRVQMGMIINRTIRHCYETDTYPAIDRKYGHRAAFKPSLAATIQFEKIKESKPVYISPYAITGFDSGYELNADGTAYEKTDGGQNSNIGIDAKFSLTSNLTVDLSANTDFAQVEADDQTVNLTRYSLFYPEKRMFFQERASIFSFGLTGSGNLFYSRRIGMDQNGTPVPILGGARLTGRVGKWDMGFMDMQTRKTKDIEAENFSVLRIRKQVINPNSYIGAMITSRLRPENNYLSYGIDGIFKVIGDDYLQVSLAQTTDTSGNGVSLSKKAVYYRFNWQRRNIKGFSYNASFHNIGQEFDPRTGFLTQSGIKGGNISLQYGWIPGPESKIFSYNFSFDFSQNNRLTDNSVESRTTGPNFSIQTKSGWYCSLNLDRTTQGVIGGFSLSQNVFIPEGEHSYTSGGLYFNTPMYKPLATSLSISGGEFYDGKSFSWSLQPVFNVSESIQLTGYYNYNHVAFPDREQQMITHIGRFEFLYMYNTRLSVSSFIQLNSLNNIIVTNLRVRYNPKEGNDLYLVYNDISPTSGYFDEGIDPVSFLYRLVQIKYVHTFRL